MEIYSYCPETGEYLGPSHADESPLEPGVYLIPAYATGKAPPASRQGKARVFVDGEWTFVPDHRGETWWKAYGDPVEIDVIGNPADKGLSKTEPAPPPPSTDPRDYSLSRFQFEGMLLTMRVTFSQIEAAINAADMTDTEKAFAISRLRNARTYNRDHPLIPMLMPAFDLTEGAVDAAWMKAKDVR
jgi:hypothetical protein